MAYSYYMVTGVDKTQTGSYDTYYDGKTSVSDDRNYAYLGVRNLLNPRSEFTFPSASKNDFTQRDLQMYTPYPTGTERGKLYLVTTDTYYSDLTVPGKGGYYTLGLPGNRDEYFVVTPTLNDPGFANSQSIAVYSFRDINDLWDNGYRIADSNVAGLNTPVTTKARWDNTKNNGAWTGGTGWNPNDPDPTIAQRSKEQIVAAMFANTTIANQIQTSTLGIPSAEQLHGAIVVGGQGSFYDNNTWKGIVPITGSLVN